MSPTKPKVRLAVVSPVLDKRNGTERIVVEWITRLQDSFEIHTYSQPVEDCDLSNIVWRQIPKLPGPHFANFVWWLLANHLWRSRKDVEFYYAAADVDAGPSLEDTFALPPAEAMACGLPEIVSAANGTSEISTNEQSGLVLNDPTNSIELAEMLRRLHQHEGFCSG